MAKFERLAPQYDWLLACLLMGAGLRFGQLTRKPLWVDEVITAIFALGQNFDQMPLDRLLPVAQVPDFFRLQPDVGWAAIANNLATQSTHPPLFFGLLHSWLVALQASEMPLVWQLRALPALFGIGAIAALYLLNALGFSARAGLLGASVIAVSPFAVYLSQEARHYTLPLLLIALSLAALIKIQQDGSQPVYRPGLWLLWGLLNVASLYAHYFCALAIAAQWLTLLPSLWRDRRRQAWRARLGAIAAGLAPLLLFLPWLPTFLAHFTSPKTGWLSEPQAIAPLYQTLASWLLMVVAPPVEGQPLALQIPSVLLSVAFGLWLAQRSWRGYRQLLRQPRSRVAALTLGSFVLWAMVAFFAIIYGLGKDISIAPRYHFVYYPAIAALLGATLSVPLPNQTGGSWRRAVAFVLAVGWLSSAVTIFNGAFQKPYHPRQVAQQFDAPGQSVLAVMAYQNTLEIAVGLSYALALAEQRSEATEPTQFALLSTQVSYDRVWAAIATFPRVDRLWVVAPGYKRVAYPERVAMQSATCQLDPDEHHRIGFPYQLYRCPPAL